MNQAVDNAVIRQSLSLVDLARPLIGDLQKKIDALFTKEEICAFDKLILTGCGDSYIAGVAAKPAFQKLAGLAVDALPAPEVAYNYNNSKFNYGKTLCIGISISGKVAATAAAMEAVHPYGAFTLGITENLEAPLAQHVDRVLKHDSPEAELAPGTATYFTSVMTLLLLAIKMGEVKGRICAEQAEAYREGLAAYCEAFRPHIDEIIAKAENLGKKLAPCTHYDCVGSGLDYASAWFARAKLYEAIGKVTAVENTEDWCHVNYFARNPQNIGTIVYVTASSPAKYRCIEAMQNMARLGRPTVAITDVCQSEIPAGIEVVSIPTAAESWMAPLMQFMPLTLLCGYLQNELGETPLRGITESPWGDGDRNCIYADQSHQIEIVMDREKEGK